jgi:hypothetical protein
MWPKHVGIVYKTYKNIVQPDGGGICVYSIPGIVTLPITGVRQYCAEI